MNQKRKKIIATLMMFLILLNNSLSVFATEEIVVASEEPVVSAEETVSDVAQEEPATSVKEDIPAQEETVSEEITTTIEEPVVEVPNVAPVQEEPKQEEPKQEETIKEEPVVTNSEESDVNNAADIKEDEELDNNSETTNLSNEEATTDEDINNELEESNKEEDLSEIMPAQSFEEQIENVHVKVTADVGAFYEGTTMKVTTVDPKTVIDNIEKTIENTVASVVAVDITFYNKDGEIVEPAKNINVEITSDEIAQMEESVVVHIDDAGTTAVVDNNDINEKAVSFEADSFSIYAVVGTETISTLYNASNGNTYEVTVTYGPEAKIPYGSTLRVTEFAENSSDYSNAKKSVLADKKARGEEIDISSFNLVALDISILDIGGNEIEPSAPVKVDLKIKALPGVENLNEVSDSIGIQHHVETGNGIVIDRVNYNKNVDASTVLSTFDVETNDKVISTGITVDPNSVNEEELIKNDQIEDNQIDVSFEVNDFSTYTITWNWPESKTTVHYGYMNGNTFVEFSEQPSPVNVNTNKTYLIYDFDGYEYSGYTYYRTSASNTPSSGGTRIQAQLRYSSNNWRYHSYSTSNSDGNWNTIANNSHIYVVYNPKTSPTTGGTPKIDDATSSDWPQDPSTPQFSKSSTNNVNGTNTVSLSINGGEKAYNKSTKANVIVVFDVSGSMDNNLNGQTRLKRAKDAVNSMANTLLNENTGVKMALISFSTTSSATPVQGFTDNYNTYRSAVNGLSADGGTNWEQALYNANRLDVDDDAATFVVFVTDGDPTYRLSRYNAPDSEIQRYDRDNRYFAYNIFGEGSADTNNRNFNAAAEEVKSILANNKTFYAIGVSSDVTKVQNLVSTAGGGTAYLATDSKALEEAFANITNSIKTTLGFGDIKITDGITELSNVEMKVMQEVDPKSFTYYKITSSGQSEWDPASEGAGLASYNKDTGAVVWNMGNNFQLEDGVTYMVTFRVWPSQEAYDLIADLNNGVKVYAAGQSNSITDEQRSQVVEIKAPTATEQGEYTLKTNTDSVNATYSQTSSTGETVTVSGQKDLTATYHEGTIENMPLESMKLTVKKVFEDDLTGGEDRDTEVTLIMKRRNGHQATASDEAFVDYPVPQAIGRPSAEIVLNDDNNWSYEVYVSPGLIVDGEVLEHGYDYTVTEPGIDYHYGLIEEIINPMVVNGDDEYYGDGQLIGDDATVKEYTDQSITAVNRVKSGIDITKKVFDTNGTTEIYPETEFTITGKLLGPDGKPYTWQNGDDVDASGAYHKYDKNGNRIVYKGHFADSSNISFTLKAGERIRFINVPDGCTFVFTESTDGMDAQGYEWKSTNALTQHRVSAGGDFTQEGDIQPVVSGQTASLNNGKSVIGNKQYSITYENKRTIKIPDLELVKVDKDDNTKKLNGAEFTLYSDEELTSPVTVDGNGNNISIVTGNKEGSSGPDGWYHIGLLPAGKYYLVETQEPYNYLFDNTPIIIEVTKGQDNYSVTATKNGTNVLSGPTEGVYTITVDNKLNITEADATKSWKNADGSTNAPEGAKVTYTLYADGEPTNYTVELDGKVDEAVPEVSGGYESAAWKAEFVNLPKYKVVEGEAVAIVYTVAETTGYPGYTASTTEPVVSGEKITNTQEATGANATKEWKNADGTELAPEGASVVYTLYADGTATDYTVTLDGTADGTVPTVTGGYESAAWKATFVNLPKYKVGTTTEIVYTIAESTTYPGYTASTTDPVSNGGKITNTQEATEASATKEWKNADGSTTAPTGASVEYTLYADGVATEYKVTLDGTADTAPTRTAGYEDAAWSAKFVNLPKYKMQNNEKVEIVYTIAETKGYGEYIASTTDPVLNGGKITNTQEATDINALKTWKNADGTTDAPEGATVEYTLYADGEVTDYKVTLDGTADTKPTGTAGYESEGWKATFVNLPKHKIVDGTTVEIVYTIAETTTYPGYTASTTDPVASGSTITNTQEVTEANATKEWENADGSTTAPEGASVVYTLYADGTATSYTVTLDGTGDETVPTVTGGYESAAWKATFVNLPKYKVGTTTEIVYTIAETTGYPGYTASPTDPVASGEKITNTQEATEANATKEWKNADGSTTAPEGASVVYTLYADGTATDYTVTLNGEVDTEPTVTGGYESAAWSATFVNLPKSKIENGEAVDIVYTIAETSGYPGYTPSTTEAVESGKEITNTQEATEANATKEWKNADGSTNAPEGAKVTYTLYADGEPTDYTVELDGKIDETVPEVSGGYESAAWKAEFVNLPKYKVVEGEAVVIEYTVAETTGYPGYTASTTEPVVSGKTITNTQETTEAVVTKIWDDKNNQDGIRPEKLIVTLSNGIEVTLNEENNWTAKVENLPKYDLEKEIEYTWKEELLEGYELVNTSKDGVITTITNKHIPGTTSINVSKTWDDLDNKFGFRPETITVRLMANGKEIKVAKINEKDNNWKYTFNNLDEYSNGKKINYSISEDEIPYYTSTITKNTEKDYTITNKIIPMGGQDNNENITVVTQVVPLYSSNPATRSRDNILLYLSLIAIASLAVIIATIKEKNRDKKIRILNSHRIKFK